MIRYNGHTMIGDMQERPTTGRGAEGRTHGSHHDVVESTLVTHAYGLTTQAGAFFDASAPCEHALPTSAKHGANGLRTRPNRRMRIQETFEGSIDPA